MKFFFVVFWGTLFCYHAWGSVITFEGNSTNVTTGELLDGIRDSITTNNVMELSGLQIMARSEFSDQKLNTTLTSFGINTDSISDETDAFDNDERAYFSFSEKVLIKQIDFNRFGDGELFYLQIGTNEVWEIDYNQLGNKTSGYLTTNLLLDENTEISFSAGSESIIGLDGLDIEIIPEPAVIGLIMGSGAGALFIRRIFI